MGHYEWDCPRHHFIVTSPHNIRGWGNTTTPAPQQYATANPRNGPSRLRKHVKRCHSNILRNTHIQRFPHVPLTLSKEVFYQNKCSTNKSYHSFKLISFLCSCLNGSLGRIWNTVIIIKYEFLFRITII